MKKVLVFSAAFMFAVVNICSAQADRVEKKPAGTATETVKPSTASQDVSSDAVRTSEPQKPASDAALKPVSSEPQKPSVSPEPQKPSASDSKKPSVSESEKPSSKNTNEPQRRSEDPAKPRPKPTSAEDKRQAPSGASQR